jgi:hypothetical protein
MKIIILILFLYCGLSSAAQVLNSNEGLFSSANPHDVLNIDSTISVYKDSIHLDSETVYKNDYSDDNYHKYIYLGLIGKQLSLIEKQTYNGSTFIVFDKRNRKDSNLNGKPYKFGDYIITINIESTTDNKNCLSIYRLTYKLNFLKIHKLPKDIIVQNIKMKGKSIFLEDSNSNYWEIKI